MPMTLRILALIFATSLSGVQSTLSCPDYASIATSRVAADKFKLTDFTGEWYLMGTSEPTLPSLCKCPLLKWSVDSDATIKKYHYTLDAKCEGVDFTATMKGEARDPQHPGSLVENMAVFNHSVAPYVPNMIFDTQTMADGNVVGFTYACLLGHNNVNMFSFNVVARKPTLTPETVKALVAKQNARTGGALKVEGIRYSDSSVCGWGTKPGPMYLVPRPVNRTPIIV